jgi:hypothetical protein
MGHVFSYPVVREVRPAKPPVPSTAVRPIAPRATQRGLVQASLLRCPAADRATRQRP